MKIIWGILEHLEEYKILAVRFEEKLKKLTNGEVQLVIKEYSADPTNPLALIENGTIDLYQITSTRAKELTNRDWLGCWNIPFLFRDKEHVEKYINSDRSKQNLRSLETNSLLPITYSYAGGFTSIVKKEGTLISDFNLDSIELKGIELGDIDYEGFSKLYLNLPGNILMYELNELSDLKDELKSMISVELTNHTVVSRITMVSKEKLSQIPDKYKGEILSMLYELLEEERQVIYRKAENNTQQILKDGKLKVIEYSQQERSNLCKVSNPSAELAAEIDFIQGIS